MVSGTGPLFGLQMNVEILPGSKVIYPVFVGYPLQSTVTVHPMVSKVNFFLPPSGSSPIFPCIRGSMGLYHDIKFNR